MRADLERFFRAAMKSIDVTNLMQDALTVSEGMLRVGEISVPLREKKTVAVVAIGKAALPMCSVAMAKISAELADGQTLRAVAVGPGDASSLPAAVRHFASGHPIPNQASRDAAEALLTLLTPLGEDDFVLFLVSGGASALVETPLDPAMSLEDVSEFYRALVHSGLPIDAMNTLRKHFSRVKGGRLAVAAAPAEQATLLINDVPGEDLSVIASGPSLPDASTVAECRALLRNPTLRGRMSAAVLRHFERPDLAETPKPREAAFRRSQHLCLLSNDLLLRQVEQLAREAGYFTEIDNSCDDRPYDEAAATLMNKVRALRREHGRVCVISGGEVSVEIHGSGGQGGRNQHFLLHGAMSLAPDGPPIAMLSAGTDGIDGNSPAAGAIVDSATLRRLAEAGVDAAQALENFDSYSALHAIGETLITGPTGNNVRDLRVLLSAD